MADESEIVHAVMNSSVPLLLNALEKGGDVNYMVDSGMTLLGQAIIIGNEEIIQILIEAENYLPPIIQHSTKPSPSVSVNSVTLRKQEDEQTASSSGVPSNRASATQSEAFLITKPDSRTLNIIRMLNRLRRNHLQRNFCDLDLPDYFNKMPIHYAIETGNLNVLKNLIDAGVKVNVCDGKKLTPLHLAVCHNNDLMVESLLRAGCSVNSKADDKSSALHMACFCGYLRSVKILLRYNAEINSKDDSERTPLFIAASKSHHSIAELLLRGGAIVNTTEIHGSTPLCMAVWHNDFELSQILFNAGAIIIPNQNLLHHAIRHNYVRIFELLMQHGACPNSYDDSGETPLHVAVRTKEMRFVNLLIHNGASVMSRRVADGVFPLHITVDVFSDDEIELFSEMLQQFLNFGVDLDGESNMTGDTVLCRAVSNGLYKISKELLRQGCNPNLCYYYLDMDLTGLTGQQADKRFVKLLLYAGYHNLHNFLRRFRVLTLPEGPMALFSLCRIVIRRCLGQNLVLKVQGMDLPNECKDFLLFKGSEFA